MKKYLFLTICLLGSVTIFGQIDLATSSVSVIGYWDKNDNRTYSISEEEYTVTGSDTTNRALTNYLVDISIIDSSPDSYTIEWVYSDYTTTNENVLFQKLTPYLKDKKVIIKTDKKGKFIEIVNWKDFKKTMTKLNSGLKNDFRGHQELDAIINQLKERYGTKESIEKHVIQEIKQFYKFHGFKYILDEKIEGQTKVANQWGGAAFDAKYTLSLDEIDLFGNNSVIRLKQAVDTKQLTDVYYYTTLANHLDETGFTMPPREEFPPMTKTIHYASRIHNEGWIVFSIRTEKTSIGNSFKFTSRIIELQ